MLIQTTSQTNNMRLKFWLVVPIFFIFWVGISSTSKAQNNSVALKTLKAGIGNAVLIQQEVKGGIHQIEGAPYTAGTIPTERLEVGMLVYDKQSARYYQYTGNDQSKEDNWHELLVITEYSKSGEAKFPKESLAIATVANNNRLFQSKHNIQGSDQSPADFSQNTWQPLSQTLTTCNSTIETLNLANTNINVTPNVHLQLLTQETYPLPNPEEYKGSIFILKNKRANNTNSNTKGITEQQINITYEGKTVAILYKNNDYVRLTTQKVDNNGQNNLCWVISGGNGLRNHYNYPIDRIPKKTVNETDGFYFGNKDVINHCKLVTYHYEESGDYYIRFCVEYLDTNTSMEYVPNSDVSFYDPTH